jgi:hypothetical protein
MAAERSLEKDAMTFDPEKERPRRAESWHTDAPGPPTLAEGVEPRALQAYPMHSTGNNHAFAFMLHWIVEASHFQF